MWQQDTFQLDNRLLNSSYHLPSNYVLGVNIGASDPVIAAAAAAAVNLTTLLSCGIKDSSLSWQQTSPATTTNLVQSPLSITSESSSNSTHSSECTTSSSVKQLQGNYTSAWSVNHTVADPSYFMSDKIDTNVNATSAGDWWSKDQQQQASQWSNFTQAPPSNLSDMEGGDWPSQLGCLGTAPEVNEQLSKMAAMEQADYSSSTTLVESDIASNPGSWILLTGEGNESGEPALDEGLHEAFNGLKKVESSTWEFPLKNQGFEMEDIKFGSHHQLDFSLGPEDRRMLDLENWNMSETQPRSSNFSMDAYNGNTAMDQRQFDPSKIKQEMDVYYSPMIGSNNNIPMQCSSDNFKSSGLTDLLGGSMISPAPGNSRWGTHSSRLPAMLSQLPNLEMPSTSSSPKHVNLFGTRPFTNYPSSSAKPAEQFKMQRMSESSMSQHSSVTSQHSYDSKDTHAGIISSKQMMEEGSREVSSDQKRSVPTTEHTSETFFKRPRIEQNPSLPLKVRKEKLGERITALQQLVSPFGKTDTASVLLEAIGYIKFLHDQIQVLSTPYMKNNANPSRSKDAVAAKGSWSTGISSSSAGDIKTKESDRPDLRSRGLCLVPLSCTLQVASDNNGADYWAPSIGGNSAK